MAATEMQNAKIGENPFKLEIKIINKDYQVKGNYKVEIRQRKVQDYDRTVKRTYWWYLIVQACQ